MKWNKTNSWFLKICQLIRDRQRVIQIKCHAIWIWIMFKSLFESNTTKLTMKFWKINWFGSCLKFIRIKSLEIDLDQVQNLIWIKWLSSASVQFDQGKIFSVKLNNSNQSYKISIFWIFQMISGLMISWCYMKRWLFGREFSLSLSIASPEDR